MGLNEDLQISSEEKRRGYGGVVLDDSNFHESANLELFDKERIISINAPDGEVREGRCACGKGSSTIDIPYSRKLWRISHLNALANFKFGDCKR